MVYSQRQTLNSNCYSKYIDTASICVKVSLLFTVNISAIVIYRIIILFYHLQKLVLYYIKMELAKETINGLTNIQNSNNLPEEIFLQLLEIIVSYICKNINDAKSKLC